MTTELQLIEDDVLVFGYVRQEIDKLNLEVPNDIKSLSYQFFGGGWNETTCPSSDIEIKQDGIIQYNEAKRIVCICGHRLVGTGEIAIWKLRLLKSRSYPSNHRIKIGIIESINDEIPESKWLRGTNILATKPKKGDWINFKSNRDDGKVAGKLLDVNVKENTIYIEEENGEFEFYRLSTIFIKFDPSIIGIITQRRSWKKYFRWESTDDMVFKGGNDADNIIGDVITMTLNLKNQHTLNFARNGSNIGFIRINDFDHSKKYRLAALFKI